MADEPQEQESHWGTPLDQIKQPTADDLIERAKTGELEPRDPSRETTVPYYDADEPAITLVLDAFQASELYRLDGLEAAGIEVGKAIADGDPMTATIEQRALADLRQKIGESMGFDVREWLPPKDAAAPEATNDGS